MTTLLAIQLAALCLAANGKEGVTGLLTVEGIPRLIVGSGMGEAAGAAAPGGQV